MSLLIFTNVVFVLIDTVVHEPGDLITTSHIIEVFSVVVFTIEYLLRLWTADLQYPNRRPAMARLRYVASGRAIIDLLSILPFYLPFLLPFDLRVLRALRLVRLVRIFKLGHYSAATAVIKRVLKKAAPSLLSSLSILSLLMIVASVLMYYVESPVQPDLFTSAFSGLWWAVSTVTTVGYGDIYPVTVLGKVFGAIIELLGIGLVAIPTGVLSAGFVCDRYDAPHQDPHLAERFAKLKNLLDAGMITENEYAAARTVILATL